MLACCLLYGMNFKGWIIGTYQVQQHDLMINLIKRWAKRWAQCCEKHQPGPAWLLHSKEVHTIAQFCIWGELLWVKFSQELSMRHQNAILRTLKRQSVSWPFSLWQRSLNLTAVTGNVPQNDPLCNRCYMNDGKPKFPWIHRVISAKQPFFSACCQDKFHTTSFTLQSI